jgi:uracil-DNA glycosylase family 4
LHANSQKLIRDLKGILEFYQAIGIKRLPVRSVPCRMRPELNRDSASFCKPLTKGDKKNALAALRADIGDCTRCKLSHKRTHIVFGEGNPAARLMFIGEAPGREEDLQGKPFVGDAGTVLTRLINKMGFQREDVYIANIVKCRPPMNRDPEIDEIEHCRNFLESQIEIIQPEVIISLGRVSAMTLTGDMKLKITAIRGKFFVYKGIPVMPTFHPAYLIRNPKDKWLTWNDAQKVLKRLEKNA